jgi:hypothetical protein
MSHYLNVDTPEKLIEYVMHIIDTSEKVNSQLIQLKGGMASFVKYLCITSSFVSSTK